MEPITVNVEATFFDRGDPDPEEEVIRKTADILASRGEKTVLNAIYDKTMELVSQKIEATLLQTIDAGWRKTDSWGEPTGKTITLGQMIRDILEKETKAGSRDRPSWLQTEVASIVRQVVSESLKDEIVNARKQFCAAVDEVLEKTIKENLARTLGLKC